MVCSLLIVILTIMLMIENSQITYTNDMGHNINKYYDLVNINTILVMIIIILTNILVIVMNW